MMRSAYLTNELLIELMLLKTHTLVRSWLLLQFAVLVELNLRGCSGILGYPRQVVLKRIFVRANL